MFELLNSEDEKNCGSAMDKKCPRYFAHRHVTEGDTNRKPIEHRFSRSEEHTSELQSLVNLVCRLLLEKNTQEYNNGVDHSF